MFHRIASFLIVSWCGKRRFALNFWMTFSIRYGRMLQWYARAQFHLASWFWKRFGIHWRGPSVIWKNSVSWEFSDPVHATPMTEHCNRVLNMVEWSVYGLLVRSFRITMSWPHRELFVRWHYLGSVMEGNCAWMQVNNRSHELQLGETVSLWDQLLGVVHRKAQATSWWMSGAVDRKTQAASGRALIVRISQSKFQSQHNSYSCTM